MLNPPPRTLRQFTDALQFARFQILVPTTQSFIFFLSHHLTSVHIPQCWFQLLENDFINGI